MTRYELAERLGVSPAVFLFVTGNNETREGQKMSDYELWLEEQERSDSPESHATYSALVQSEREAFFDYMREHSDEHLVAREQAWL